MKPGRFLQMDTAAAGQVFAGLADASADLRERWRGALAAIAAGEAGIGGDRLAAAFRAGYDGPSKAARSAADVLPARLTADSDAGRACAEEYEAADARGAAAFARQTTG